MARSWTLAGRCLCFASLAVLLFVCVAPEPASALPSTLSTVFEVSAPRTARVASSSSQHHTRCSFPVPKPALDLCNLRRVSKSLLSDISPRKSRPGNLLTGNAEFLI